MGGGGRGQGCRHPVESSLKRLKTFKCTQPVSRLAPGPERAGSRAQESICVPTMGTAVFRYDVTVERKPPAVPSPSSCPPLPYDQLSARRAKIRFVTIRIVFFFLLTESFSNQNFSCILNVFCLSF